MVASKLHIIIIPTWMPTETSTSGIFTREQTDALAAAGHKVSIVMFQYVSLLTWLKKKLKGKPLSSWLKGRLVTPKAYNFVYVGITRFSTNPQTIQKKAFLKYAEKKFKQYIKENGKPDIIHHHEIADFCYITAHLSKKFGIPYVITEHSPSHPDNIHFNPYETKEERMEMIHNASARIAVSTFYQKKYEQIFKVPFITVPNLVSNDFAQIPLPSFPKQKNNFHFITIGSLSQVKRQDILIQAFAEAFKNIPAIDLTIVGVGALESKLKELVSLLKMDDRIHFAGYKPKEELMKLLDESHVLVVSSETETFSVAAAEALFRGNPVVTTRCGGPEDFITAENGLICEVNNVNDMKGKLLKIYAEYAFYNQVKIAEKAKELFSERVVVAKLEDIYRSVIAE